GSQIKMIGVTEDDLSSKINQLLLCDRLNGSGRADRHEDRSLNFSVIGDDRSQACLGRVILVCNVKFQRMHFSDVCALCGECQSNCASVSLPCSSSNGRRKLVAPLCRLEEPQVGGHVCSPASVTMSDQPRRAKCRSTQATTWLFQLRP